MINAADSLAGDVPLRAPEKSVPSTVPGMLNPLRPNNVGMMSGVFIGTSIVLPSVPSRAGYRSGIGHRLLGRS